MTDKEKYTRVLDAAMRRFEEYGQSEEDAQAFIAVCNRLGVPVSVTTRTSIKIKRD